MASHPTMGAWIEIPLVIFNHLAIMSHPTMGAWIEMVMHAVLRHVVICRTPRWVRGLKFLWVWYEGNCESVAPHDGCVDWNLVVHSHNARQLGRTPRWVRGLKCTVRWQSLNQYCRTPRWVRGLKYLELLDLHLQLVSHPTMGAWIEIKINEFSIKKRTRSHPTMGAWIEI